MHGQSIGRDRLTRWTWLAVAALTIVVLLTTAGSVAAASKERVGDRISLLAPVETYPAGTAFHIWHGFVFEDSDIGYGRYEFALAVDGIPRAANFFDVEVLDRGTVSKVWVFNFPAGLTGIHTFEGQWITPNGTGTISVTVAFTP